MCLSPTYAEAVKEDQSVSNNLKSKTKKVAPIMVTTTDFVFDSILVQVHLLICLKLPPVTIPMTTGQAQQKWWLNWHLIRFDLMEKKGWKRMKRRPRGRLNDPPQWAISDSDEAIVPFVGDVRSV